MVIKIYEHKVINKKDLPYQLNIMHASIKSKKDLFYI